MGTAKSIKEGVSSTVGTNDDADDRTKDLESAQVHEDRLQLIAYVKKLLKRLTKVKIQKNLYSNLYFLSKMYTVLLLAYGV